VVVVVVDGAVDRVVDVVDTHVVLVAGVSVVAAPGTPLGSVLSIVRPRAVIAPTTMRTTSDTRIVYSSTDAPHSLFTAK
jgi:hypothetical protein